MQNITVERNNASRGHNQRVAGIRSSIPNEVIGTFFFLVIDDLVLCPSA